LGAKYQHLSILDTVKNDQNIKFTILIYLDKEHYYPKYDHIQNYSNIIKTNNQKLFQNYPRARPTFLPACTYVQRGSKFCFVVVVVVLGDTLIKLRACMQFGILPLQFGIVPLQFGILPLQFGILPLQFGILPLQYGDLPR
jgi:hypothetical protein